MRQKTSVSPGPFQAQCSGRVPSPLHSRGSQSSPYARARLHLHCTKMWNEEHPSDDLQLATDIVERTNHSTKDPQPGVARLRSSHHSAVSAGAPYRAHPCRLRTWHRRRSGHCSSSRDHEHGMKVKMWKKKEDGERSAVRMRNSAEINSLVVKLLATLTGRNAPGPHCPMLACVSTSECGDSTLSRCMMCLRGGESCQHFDGQATRRRRMKAKGCNSR